LPQITRDFAAPSAKDFLSLVRPAFGLAALRLQQSQTDQRIGCSMCDHSFLAEHS
jgi:hypothetical protein